MTGTARNIFGRLRAWANENQGLVTLIGVLVTAVGILGPPLAQAATSILGLAPQLASLLQRYGDPITWIGLSLLALAAAQLLWSHGRRLSRVEEQLQILETLPEVLLDESTAANISNWAFQGRWSIEDGSLSVTASSSGGLCKIGATWENYEFSFEFRIMHESAAWIVRAQSPHHYVMIQCNNRQLRPHVRRVIPRPDQSALTVGFELIKEVDHGVELADWNSARTEVRGHGIRVWIGERLVWSDADLLASFPVGTVGFRCHGAEHAMFRNIRVEKKRG